MLSSVVEGEKTVIRDDLMGMMIVFTGAFFDTAQKYRKYWLLRFHTGLVGFVADQVCSW